MCYPPDEPAPAPFARWFLSACIAITLVVYAVVQTFGIGAAVVVWMVAWLSVAWWRAGRRRR